LQILHSNHRKEFGNHPAGYHCSYHISLSAETVKENFKLLLTTKECKANTFSCDEGYTVEAPGAGASIKLYTFHSDTSLMLLRSTFVVANTDHCYERVL
jgi:hypothetical protein